MEISHTYGFHENEIPGYEDALRAIGIEYRVRANLVSIKVNECDPRWEQVEHWVEDKKPLRGVETYFDIEEVLSAEWVRLLPGFEQGYPQPAEDMAWRDITLENVCPDCGAGYRQKAPFRLLKEPRMGKYDFLSPTWTYTFLGTPKIIKALGACGLRGYQVWPAMIHRSDTPSKVVSQLVFPHVAGPGLAAEHKLRPETCPSCGITKYAYHRRGYMRVQREALTSEVDVQQTHEWFGSGRGDAWREVLISGKFARLILEEGWLGVWLKPVELM
ncbi:MAG: hypothetical protein HY665_03240 [Chloroflexi bacterium]|nr:hypothetical protein [Chloroflexota bacterium]